MHYYEKGSFNALKKVHSTLQPDQPSSFKEKQAKSVVANSRERGGEWLVLVVSLRASESAALS